MRISQGVLLVCYLMSRIFQIFMTGSKRQVPDVSISLGCCIRALWYRALDCHDPRLTTSHCLPSTSNHHEVLGFCPTIHRHLCGSSANQ